MDVEEIIDEIEEEFFSRLLDQELGKCKWCGKHLDLEKRYPVAWYDYLTAEEMRQMNITWDHEGGRFCSVEHLIDWIQSGTRKES